MSINEEIAKLGALCAAGAEWTRIGSQGKRIKPRFVANEHNTPSKPPSFTATCFDTKPNRFLLTLKNTQPTLYNTLSKRPTTTTTPWSTDTRGPFKSTYQIDYGHEPEYPEGLYND
jgi:hypothetical protein